MIFRAYPVEGVHIDFFLEAAWVLQTALCALTIHAVGRTLNWSILIVKTCHA